MGRVTWFPSAVAQWQYPTQKQTPKAEYPILPKKPCYYKQSQSLSQWFKNSENSKMLWLWKYECQHDDASSVGYHRWFTLSESGENWK